MRRKKRRDLSSSEPLPEEATTPGEEQVLWHVLVLTGEDKQSPFEGWYLGLRELVARARITARITRILQAGNFGDHRERISGAISEQSDIETAAALWEKYKDNVEKRTRDISL